MIQSKLVISAVLTRVFRWVHICRNAFSRRRSLRMGFITDEFSHPDLMPFGGYGMTLKYVTDFLNTRNGSSKAHVLMCQRKDSRKAAIGRYHNADLFFLPRWPGVRTQLQCAGFMTRRNVNLLIGVDHFESYEYYLESFPYIPWMVWIKAPVDKTLWERLATVPLEIKAWGVEGMQGLIKQGERQSESLHRMLELSRQSGRKVHFAAEAKHLADIAQRLYGLPNLNAFHLPKPIPVHSSSTQSFSERPCFLLLGRLDPVKRPWIFFKLAKRFKGADFYVAGKTHHPEIMNPVLAKYENIPNLRFLGLVVGTEKENLLNRVWAVVNTSIHEGVAVSVLEAFSYGKTAIAALDPDGLISSFGLYVGEASGNGDDPETLDRFSSALEQVIRGAFDKERNGVRARNYVAEFHSFPRFESSLMHAISADAYQGVTAKPSHISGKPAWQASGKSSLRGVS